MAIHRVQYHLKGLESSYRSSNTVIVHFLDTGRGFKGGFKGDKELRLAQRR